MSQVEVTVSVGGEDPMVYVSRVQTVVVNSEDQEELLLGVSAVAAKLIDNVRAEVMEQLTIVMSAGS